MTLQLIEQTFIHKRVFLGLVLGLGLSLPSLATDFETTHNLAKQGNTTFQTLLGIMYLEGEVVEQNPTEALRWLEKAANQGNGNAQILTASGYEDGVGVTKDKSKAKEWYKMACNNNEQEGCSRYKKLAGE